MAHNYQGGYQPPYQGQPPPQGYGQPPQQGYHQPPPMQNQQYPVQGHQPQQGWGQPPPPGQYGAPPPNSYGAPQGQYGAPPPPQQGYGAPPPGHYQQPPPGQYGAPPPNQYAPPPQGQYGAPPPQGQYGAPPPQGQYGAPPPHHGAPPPGQFHGGFGGGPPAQPSLGYGPLPIANMDMSADVEGIRKAMKGFGTNEKVLIGIVAKKDPIQIATIRAQYSQRLMRNLTEDLIAELSGYFEKGMVEICRGPLESDCYNLMEAMKGLGTNEVVLDDVLVGRSNADVNAIKQKYHQLFKRTLEADLRGDLSGGTLDMYMMIIAAHRAEDSQPVNPQEVDQDVNALHHGLGTMFSKNGTQVCQILTCKNDAQLRAISTAYQQRFHKDFDSALRTTFSGHMQEALRLLVHRANNRADAEAIRLEDSMAGLGTKDVLLVQRVVRCHWDRNFMGAVSAEYKRRYKKDLVKRIEGEIRGDYERLMVACVKP
ncbi:Annexin [Dothidotthia symphoricarpi CBS 119687]|uniref:Annexin n=1 Tax=Dothidotthia symphoricarpi CBS 119687 TaxID=1392245 RepID=A0A6A6AVU3_9PLEO|nr:Annexin [Dothidotthia symphoricarpi CBS 119687]KAF2134957.1 Annexin [Dothidotthia symphoricarpi CBS 119687]